MGLIIAISLPAIKIIPIYIKSIRITSTLKNLKSDMFLQVSAKNPENLKKELLNRLGIENISEVTADEITVTKVLDKYNVRIKHQYMEKILKDRYFILDVDESVDMPIIKQFQ
ncbi:MAG: DUF4845 domain-containing protein [Smithella sp.]